MNYYTISPPHYLAGYVRFFWVLECEVPEREHYVHRSMADGSTELIFHYKGRFSQIPLGDELFDSHSTDRSFLSGIHSQSRSVRRFMINQSFGIFGAYLYPYAISGLFSIPANEIANQMIELDDLAGHEGACLREQMMLASSNSERAGILADFLYRRLQKQNGRPHQVQSAVKRVIDQCGTVDINNLADDYCVSRRQFERKFKELAGFSPKLYARIVRFQSVFEKLGSTRQFTLAEVAHRCGYYDQSHFIHDFKEFSGYNPREFMLDESTESVIWRAKL